MSKAYAEELSAVTGIPCVSYGSGKGVTEYEQTIYFGGLYAGGVNGLNRTCRLLKNSQVRMMIAAVGLADVNRKENTDIAITVKPRKRLAAL